MTKIKSFEKSNVMCWRMHKTRAQILAGAFVNVRLL